MKKIIVLLPLLLASCSVNQNVLNVEPNEPIEDNSPYDLENWSYTEPEEEAIVVTKEGVEVSSVEIIDIPREGIKIAAWDEYDIKIKVLYSDNSTETIPFYEKYIPIEFRHYLGEIGHHSISIMVNASSVNFGFDIIKNDEFHGFTCNFFDDRDAQSKLLLTKVVGYYADVNYDAELPESRVIDDDVNQSFVGWDHSLKCVSQDMIYKAKFRNVEKRFYGDNLDTSRNMLIASSKKDEKYRALSYLGRIHAVAINYGETVHHILGNSEDALTFSPLNPYGVKWTQMNEDIVKYAINYSYDANYGTYLYGTTGAFGESVTVLSDFESYYSVSSQSELLETGALIDTSILPSFSNCYTLSESKMSEYKTIDPIMESGYYRVALTVSFDVYVSTTFTKVTDNRYSLVPGAKFIFSPVIETQAVRLEFSETSTFDNPYKKQLVFSTKNLYDVANGLDW